MSNRIVALQSAEPESLRISQYSNTLDQTLSKKVSPLTPEEIQTLASKIMSETNGIIQSLQWRLLATASTQNETAQLEALRQLENLHGRNRGDALFYLRRHYPEMMPELYRSYEQDTDPTVSYELAHYMSTFAPEAAVDRKIEVMSVVEEHDLYDPLMMEISEEGTHQNLLNLRRRIAQGETVFTPIAEALAARLT